MCPMHCLCIVHKVNAATVGRLSEGRPQPQQPVVSANGVVLVLAVAGIIGSLMQTLVIPLLGDLPELLDTSASNATWVVTATLLTAAVATPVNGRLGDLYGKRRMMLVCAGALVLGSIVCALSATVLPMVVGRGIQGIGMGLIPLGVSAMRDLLPAEMLGSSIALMSASMGVGGALGLPLSAAVAETNWRLLFWGATAISVLIFVLIFTLIPETPITAVRARFDFGGAVGLGAALVALLLGVSKGADWGWTSVTTLSLLIGSVIAMVVWGWFELRIAHPLVDLRITARPVVLLTNITSVVVGFAMYAEALTVPQLMQLPKETGYGLGTSMLEMGLWMMPGGIVMMLVSPLGARLSHYRGPKITLAAGSLVIAVGYLACVALMGSAFGLMIAVAICSAGVGLAYGAMPALIMGSVPVSETASANSFNSLARSVGTSIAAAVVGVVLAQMTMDAGGITLTSENGFKTALFLGAGVGLIAAVLAMTIPSRASQDAEDRIEHEGPLAVS